MNRAAQNNQLLFDCQRHIKYIIKLQAWARGNRVRKQLARSWNRIEVNGYPQFDQALYQASAKNVGGNDQFPVGMVGQNYLGREIVSETENEDWDNPEQPSPREDFK